MGTRRGMLRIPRRVPMYNSVMQFEVPQFIEIEDKIFGPLTWRQFIYLGGGISFGVVLLLIAHWLLFVFIGLPLMLVAVALAFIPINSRPFSYFLEAVYNYITRQKLYVWKQDITQTYKYSFLPGQTNSARTPEAVTPTKRSIKSTSINDLARKLELNALQKK